MKKGTRKKEEIFAAQPTAPIVNDQALHQAISEKAYALYQKGGQRHGHDLEDWLEAEQLVLSMKKEEKKLTSVPPIK